jgi:hypothetical protein
LKKLDLLIKPDGFIQILTSGYEGEACLRETEELLKKMKSLGLDVETMKIEKTAEATKTSTGSNVRQGG